MSPLAVCAVLALVLLALEGMVLTRLVSDPTVGWPDRREADALRGYWPGLSQRAEAAGSWTRLLAALESRRSPSLAPSARRGVEAVDAVRARYRALLAPLQPHQRRRVLQAEQGLVDPFFPGLGSSSERVYLMCVGALVRRAAGGSPGAEAGVPLDDPLPPQWTPQGLFWSLTRAVDAPGSDLEAGQCVATLAALNGLRGAVQAYHEVRADLWGMLGLSPVPRGDRPPPFPFPTTGELDRVHAALMRAGGP